MNPILIGVTGASGSLYAKLLAEAIQKLQIPVELVLTEAGEQVLRYEHCADLLKSVDVIHKIDNYFAPPASGTAKYKAMVVVPCSMGSLAKMAHGTCDNLLIRSADVFLKERRPLIIVPREMPMHAMHLENMAILARLGATLIPASPFFYHHPQTVEELAGTVVGKIMDHLGLEHSFYKAWGQS